MTQHRFTVLGVLRQNISDGLRQIRNDFLRTGQAAQQAGQTIDLSATGDTRKSQDAKARLLELQRAIATYRTQAKGGANFSIGEMENFEKMKQEVDFLKGGFKNLQGGALSISEIFFKMRMALLVTAFAFTAVRMAMGAAEFISAGAKLEGIATTFRNLSAASGVMATDLLANLRAASKGTVDMATLMVAGNRAMMVGGAEFAEKLPSLMKTARAASIASGQDINYVFSTLVKGIAKASPLLIDNAEIYIRVGDAVEEYAQKHGKLVSQLTSAEQKQAMINATEEQGRNLAKALGAEELTASEKVDKLKAGWKDLSTDMGRLLGITDGVAWLGEQFSNIAFYSKMTSDNTEMIRKIADVDPQRVVQLANAMGMTAKTVQEVQAAGPWLSQDQIKDFNDRLTKLYQDIYKVNWDPLSEGEDILRAYKDAFAKITIEGSGAGALQKKLGELAGQLTVLATAVPPSPLIPSNFLQYDEAQWKEFIQLLKETSLYASDNQYREGVLKFEKDNDRLAKSAEDTVKEIKGLSLQEIAVKFYGPGAGVDSLVKDYAKFSPAVQDVLDAKQLLNSAFEATPAQKDTIFLEGIDQIEKMSEKMAQTFGPGVGEAFFNDMVNGWRDTWARSKATTTLGLNALKQETMDRYDQIVAEALKRQAKIDEVNKQLGDVKTSLEDAIAGNTQVPSITPGPTLGIDSTELENWLLLSKDMPDANQAAIGSVQLLVDSLNNSKTGMFQFAGQITDAGSRLAFLRVNTIGLSGSVQDLMTKIQGMNPAMRKLYTDAMDVATAISAISNAANQMPTIDDFVLKEADAEKSIDQSLVGMVGVYSQKAIEAKRSQRTRAMQKMVADLKNEGKAQSDFEIDVAIAGLLKLWEEEDSLAKEQDSKRKKRSDEFESWMWRTASDLEQNIESALHAGENYVDKWTKIARPDKFGSVALQSAAALEEIAARGYSALRVHPEWIQQLQIPENILRGGARILKGWARETAKDVQDLTRPDLINWEGFGHQWDRLEQQIGARQLTISTAVEFLKKSGRGKGKTIEELQKQAAELLGLENPSITFETMFKADPSTYPATIRAWLRGKSAAEVPIRFIPTNTFIPPTTPIPVSGTNGGVYYPRGGGIPMMATGGISSGGLTLVGERGPELVNLNPGSAVYPNGMGPGGINISVEVTDGAVRVSGGDVGNVGRLVGETISEALQQLARTELNTSVGAKRTLPGNF